MKCYADNVLVQLEPLETMTAGGLHLPQQTRRGARGHRFGRVLASGPGHHRQKSAGSRGTQDGVFVPNETKPGDRVIMDAQAGQLWEADLSVPRHNEGHEFGEIGEFSGELRMVREAEILAVIDDG